MVAGPACARTLAEYGADVIKIDSPKPLHGPRNTCWYGIEVGQGKRSVLIDLKSLEGRELFWRLLDWVATGFAASIHGPSAALHLRRRPRGAERYHGTHCPRARRTWRYRRGPVSQRSNVGNGRDSLPRGQATRPLRHPASAESHQQGCPARGTWPTCRLLGQGTGERLPVFATGHSSPNE